MRLTERISRFIDAESLLTRGSRVIVGLSGGADSVALLAILTELGFECTAIHCHFGLRGDEADRDSSHAAMIARRLGATFREVRFDTIAHAQSRGISIEMACRELRYAEFERLRIEFEAEAIAVGHHQEDNIETMFLNLLRGCGLHGVRGMLPKNGYIIRPMLETSRSEIIEYLDKNSLPYVVDSTNLQNDYKRNRLRNLIIPAIAEAFPDAPKTLATSLRNLRECDKLYNHLLPPRSESLAGITPTLLHEWLQPFGFNASQCRDILTAETGAEFQTDSYILTIIPNCRYELKPINLPERKPNLKVRTFSASIPFKPQRGHLYLDSALIAEKADWELRLWREGDRIQPFGMNGYRLASDVMRDCGISSTARRHTWVLTRNGELLWIVGHRASNHFAVTTKTAEITEIYIYHEEI